jgi:hypothetical protein
VKADHGDEVSFVFRYYLNSNGEFSSFPGIGMDPAWDLIGDCTCCPQVEN